MSRPAPLPPPILSVRHLKVQYRSRRTWPWQPRGWVRALDDLHLDLRPGETLGIVGESGCGKSTLARALVGLQATSSGSIRYGGQDLTKLSKSEWRPLRRELQMVFQDPLASLNPKLTVGQIVAEPLRELCPEIPAAEHPQRVAAMLERVGLSGDILERKPHEFSGGQAQRIGIARALIVRPKVLICDEAVSALDVSVRAQIVNLLVELRQEYGLTLIFIAHDLAIVRYLCDRVLVMYLGKVMEQAASTELFAAPKHPYTRALLAAAPSASAPPQPAGNKKGRKKRKTLSGNLPSPALPPMGCVFHTRCPLMETACVASVPNLRRVGPDHYAACHFVAAPDSVSNNTSG
ncbi:MAG: ATP-binding cassette domain-containing protein [Nevskia sp.]|nr:ATP-binding cassette domain-containing protein [Nevskia sp.]